MVMWIFCPLVITDLWKYDEIIWALLFIVDPESEKEKVRSVLDFVFFDAWVFRIILRFLHPSGNLNKLCSFYSELIPLTGEYNGLLKFLFASIGSMVLFLCCPLQNLNCIFLRSFITSSINLVNADTQLRRFLFMTLLKMSPFCMSQKILVHSNLKLYWSQKMRALGKQKLLKDLEFHQSPLLLACHNIQFTCKMWL